MSLDRLKISRTSGKQAGELRPERRRVRGKTKDFDRIYWVRDKVPGQPVSKRNAPLAKEVAKQPTSPKVEAAKVGAYTPAKLPKSLKGEPPKLRLTTQKLESIEGFDAWDPESAEGYILKNANRIKEFGRQLKMQLGMREQASGVTRVTTDSNITAANGFYDGKGEVSLTAKTVAGLQSATNGEDTPEARMGAKTLLHELFHSTSKFERDRLTDPERFWEEAATEILAQRYLPEFAEASGFKGVAEYKRGPLFEGAYSGPGLGSDRHIAYFTEVSRFAKLAARMTRTDTKDGAAVERAAVNLALSLKRTSVSQRSAVIGKALKLPASRVDSWAASLYEDVDKLVGED